MGKRKYDIQENELGKKIKSSDSQIPEDVTEQPQTQQTPKNEKEIQNHKFDMKHFRKELSSKQGQTMVLTQFLNVCLNPDKDVDYISEYLKHSPIWERTLDFLIKLIDKMKPEEIVQRMKNLTPLQTANFVRFVTLPVPLLKHIQPNIGKDQTISLYCAKVLVKMLQLVRRYIQILDIDDTHARVSELRNKLEYFLPKHVPPPAAIVSLIRDVVEGNNTTKGADAQDYQLPKPDDADALLVLVELLLLYNDLHPAFFESLEGNIDMKSILDYTVTLSSPKTSLLKFKIVSLWLTLDNTAVSINNPMFKELFRIMLDVYTNDSDDTWIEAEDTIREFFRNTTIFEGDENEIYIMLHTLRNVKVEPIVLIGNIVEYAIANKKEHTEFVRNQIVHFEISDTNKEENLDTLFKDLMRNKSNDENVFVENAVPSSFIVSSLQYTQNNKDAKKNLKHFLSFYVANLLHCNFSAEMTEILMGDSKLDVERKDEFAKVTESSIWQNFCKAVLKDSLRVKTANQPVGTGPILLSLLTKLIKLFYPDGHADVVTLFDMVTSHSEFLNVMLSHHSPAIKSRLLQILHALISINKTVMKSQQIPVYLSAYGATRSPCDRLILSLLYMYESNAQPVNEYKPYVWGDSAANYYAVRKNRTSSLWGHPTPNQVLNLFDRELVERTVRHFPVTERLEYIYELSDCCVDDDRLLVNDSVRTLLEELNNEQSTTSVYDNESSIKRLMQKSRIDKILLEFKEKDMTGLSHADTDPEIYDPVFIFSLLSHLLAPGSVASCFKLLRTGLLSVPVMALSSHCPLMRSAAYHVLHRFCLLLETETKHKNDKLFLTDFVTTLRLSLSTAIERPANGSSDFSDVKNPRLPAVGALYLARALMSVPRQRAGVCRAEAVDPRRDLRRREDHDDANVVFKSMCLKMAMDFYSTVLCDRRTREGILGALNSIVSVPRAFEILMEGYGLLAWLHCAARQLARDEGRVAVKMFHLLESMLRSLRVLAFDKFASNNFHNAKIADVVRDVKSDKDVEFKILLIANELSGHLDGLELADVRRYLGIYRLVSRRVVKFLTAGQILNLINKCGALANAGESVELLSRSVTTGAVMLRSAIIESSMDAAPDNGIVKDLVLLVQAYLA
ncbi:unnamed protein product, partial [Iphiclides podalirius]